MEETKISVDTTLGRKKLIKQKTLKVRVDDLDLLELDKICHLEGFAERATMLRKLIHSYQNIALGNQIVQRYHLMLKSKREFEDLVALK